VIAGVLGALPGCLGPWAIVALYSHGLVSLGALVTAMIATSGDESYLMMAVIPRQALAIFAGLLVCGIAVGALVDFVLRGRQLGVQCQGLTFHPEDASTLVRHGRVLAQLSSPSAIRVLLMGGFLLIIVLIGVGQIGNESIWIQAVSLAATSFALFVVTVVPTHFLEAHLWGHVVRRHAGRIFLWTLGALFLTHLIVDVLHLHTFSAEGRWTMLIAACLVGIIPQSGPHMIFVTLFAKEAIPLSVLLANSIVQDGHGMLPLLAESRRAFIVVKAINIAAGLLVGAAALAMGF
jgi:hypothetical protein